MRIEWDVPIAMDDGLVLRADVFRPIADGRHPVILTYGPYAKGLAFQDGYPSAWHRMVAEHPDVPHGSSNKYQSWEVVDPEKWVPDGYACVRVDSRGAGRSPGYIDHFSPRETKDFYDCIEWAGVQSWSNGKVGLNGISYFGMNQWHVASLQPRHLAAMCVWEGAADFYRDMTHHGGILSTFWANWYDMQVKTVQYGLGERGPRSRVTGELVCGDETLSEKQLYANRCDFGDEILAHPLDDAYHKARSPVWEKITAPLLTAANWGGQGLHPRGNFEGFVRAASTEKWLEAHGIEHWTHFYTDYGRLQQKRFFDYFLKGEKNGWDKQPRVQLQVRHPEKFVERHEGEWPIARTQWTKFHLDPTGQVLSREPSKAAASIAFDALGDGLTFLSPPFERETEITGPLAAKLTVVVDVGRRPLPRLRVHRRLREVTFGGNRSAHADRAGLAPRVAPQARPEALDRVPAVSHARRGAAAQARRAGRAGRRALADVDRRAGRSSHRAQRPRPGLRMAEIDRCAPLELQERAARLRPVPARRSARPAGGRVRRPDHAARRTRPAGLRAGADHPAEVRTPW
jgi:predicted acyl esterase